MFYVPTNSVNDWRCRLAQPEKHWAIGRSAMMLACCWEEAVGFPPEVDHLMETIPFVDGPVQFLAGFPEHKTPLPGGRRSSQSDILVLAAVNTGLLVIAVEGKVDEGFDKPVTAWLGPDPSPGKRLRLRFLVQKLGLTEESVADLPYQLLHRTAAAVIEADRFRATPMMMVHSWGAGDDGFDEYAQLLALLGAEAQVGRVTVGRVPNNRDILFGWVRGDDRWRAYSPEGVDLQMNPGPRLPDPIALALSDQENEEESGST